MNEPLLIQYTKLLHQYRDPDAPEVKRFLSEHSRDSEFLKRAQTLNRLFQLKEK